MSDFDINEPGFSWIDRSHDYIADTCCVCNDGIYSSAPRMVIGSEHVCTECFPDLIIDYCNLTGMGNIQPFILTAILEKCYKRKRRKAIPKAIREKVFNKYKMTCVYCGAKSKLEIDHIRPFSKGGEDVVSNLQVLCKACNVKKSNKIKL